MEDRLKQEYNFSGNFKEIQTLRFSNSFKNFLEKTFFPKFIDDLNDEFVFHFLARKRIYFFP